MKKKLPWAAGGLVLVFLLLQLARPEKNLQTAPGPNDFMVKYPPPPAVRQILTVACYDCHSNNTRYPWYAEIQPLGWWLAGHVRDAKAELNFSEFAAYPAKRVLRKLDACTDEVTDKGMPLPSYRLAHADARLTPEQIKLLNDWFDTVHDKIEDQ